MRRRVFLFFIVVVLEFFFINFAYAVPLKADLLRTSARITNGTQDFTIPGFGEVKAAIIVLSNAKENNVMTGDAPALSFGVTDGFRQYAISSGTKDGVTEESNYGPVNVYSEKNVAVMLDYPEKIVATASFLEMIPDGIRLNWTLAPSQPVLITVTLLGGDSLNVYAGSFVAPTTSDTEIDITAPGFLPDTVILAGSSAITPEKPNIPGHFAEVNIGFAKRSPAYQTSFFWNSWEDTYPTSQSSFVSTQYVYYSALQDVAIEINNFDSTGFSAWTRLTSQYSWRYFYLVFESNDSIKSWVGVLDSPTTLDITPPGDYSFTAPGIKPEFALMMTNPTGSPTDHIKRTNFVGAGSAGITILANDKMFTNGILDTDGLNMADTESWSSDLLWVRRADKIDTHIASLVSFDDSGLTFHYTTVLDDTVRKWPTLIIGTQISECQGADEYPYGNCDQCVNQAELEAYIQDFYNNGISISQLSDTIAIYLTDLQNPSCP